MVDFNLRDKRRERIFRYAPLILWIALIFYLSSGQASMPQTSRFIRPLLEFLFPNSSEEIYTAYHAFIRKFAHFFVYAVLAFWSWRAVKESSKAVLQKYKYLFSLALVFLVASIDETNQSYNVARTGSIYDVLLDFTGGLTVVLITYWATRNKTPN
ncbi:MAG TPA: VanZ family protein [Pyrinomonadaceae bacterium]|jgi:VanZ family protein